MITIYNETETDFKHNGLGALIPSSCYVEEKLNGLYELELEHPIDRNNKWQHLVEGNIIKASTPQGNQLFRIYRKQKTMNSIYINARHIFYDLIDNFLEDVRPTNLNGAGALEWILSNTQYPHNFTSMSDIESLNTAYFIRKNPVEAINTVIGRWDGELVRDNYIIKLLTQRGADRGATIRYGKNLIGIEEDLDLDSVITKLVPQGFDGLLLPERYIDSPLINKYPHPKIRKFQFPDIKVDEENNITKEIAINELRKVATEWMTKNKIDIPKVNYRVDFIELSKTEEYKDYAVLERVYLGDIVTVKHEKLGFDLKSKVIKYRWDSIIEKYIEIELGNFKQNLSDSFKTLEKTLDEMSDVMEMNKSDLSKAIDNATNLMTTALGGYVLKRENEILIMDTDDVMTAQKVWRWNVNGLGYSNTGYNGNFELAMTMDGAIVADFITTGVLNANLIKAGLLKSKKGNTWINMDDGTFNFADRVKFDGNTFDINISGTKTEKEINNRVAETEKNAKEYTDTNIDNVNTEIEKVTSKISEAELKITPDAIISTVRSSEKYKSDLNQLQEQIDGQIEIWFYDGVPTLSNVPAKDWSTTTLKDKHLGDLYYDNKTGYAYRFKKNGSNYEWFRIIDADIVKALEDARKAQDTADGKKRVFSKQPIPPYDIGDLWSQGNTGDMMICKTARATGQYSASDWEKSSKYTDDTLAKLANDTANGLVERVSKAEQKITDKAIISTVTESDRFLKYTLTPKSSKLAIERKGLSLNPLETFNYTGGKVYQENEPIIINSGEIVLNYLADTQVTDNYIYKFTRPEEEFNTVRSEILQTASQIRQEVKDVSNGLEGSITTQADKIKLMVREDNSINGDNLVSAINLSSKKIEMKSLNIDLTGYVTVSNLSQSGKTIINGDNIKTGKVASLNGYSYFDLANNRFLIGNSSNYLMYFDGSNLNFGSNVTLSWNNLPSSVASTNDIVSENRVTQITYNTISTASISASQITTGTLATERLLGDVLNFNGGHSIDNRNGAFRFKYSDYNYLSVNGDDISFYLSGVSRAVVRRDGFYNVRDGVGYKLAEVGGTALIPKFG